MYFLGLDLGQKQDPAALAVVEKTPELKLMVRYVERAPLGTPYPRVVDWVRQVATNRLIAGRCELAVDATGVGAPVVEMLRAARLGCDIAAVTMTGGERETQSGQTWNVPKRDLMAGLQVALESRDLTIAGGIRELEALVRELVDVQVKTRESGHARIGADGNGEHDDLVIAVALAVWRAKKPRPPQNLFGKGPLF
jgi:phage FluMu gp28-like protein